MHKSIRVICGRAKQAILPALLLGILTSGPPAGAVDPPLDESQIRDALTGNRVTLRSADLQRIEAHFEPGGVLRGRYKGEDFVGSWSVDDDMLCLDFPGDTDDFCRMAVRINDDTLKLYTSAGDPAGLFYVEPGNAEGPTEMTSK